MHLSRVAIYPVSRLGEMVHMLEEVCFKGSDYDKLYFLKCSRVTPVQCR